MLKQQYSASRTHLCEMDRAVLCHLWSSCYLCMYTNHCCTSTRRNQIDFECKQHRDRMNDRWSPCHNTWLLDFTDDSKWASSKQATTDNRQIWELDVILGKMLAFIWCTCCASCFWSHACALRSSLGIANLSVAISIWSTFICKHQDRSREKHAHQVLLAGQLLLPIVTWSNALKLTVL